MSGWMNHKVEWIFLGEILIILDIIDDTTLMAESKEELKSFLVKVKMKSLSCVWLFPTKWTIAHQASPFRRFSRQEYWSGLPFRSPGDLTDPGIEPRSPALQADALPSEPPGKPRSPPGKPRESERGEWKSWLRTQHSKNEDHGIRFLHFTANWWGNHGNSDRLHFLGSKITENGDCSHEIKRCLLIERKAMKDLDRVLL